MKKIMKFIRLIFLASLLVVSPALMQIVPALSANVFHQTSEDISLIAQSQKRNDENCRMGVVLFTGFASQSLADGQTGLDKLAYKLEALESPKITTKVLSWYDDDDDSRDIDADDRDNGDIEAEVDRIANLPYSNGLILIGHSLGGDEALEQAELRDKVQMLIQIDSVGYDDSKKPLSVVTGLNYYQLNESSVLLRDIETNVRGSLNINANEFDPSLDHGSIDDSDLVHQDIIRRIQATTKTVCSSQPDERTGKQRRGRNFGDPHLLTFDGHRYSFQDVGEFILAKSDDNLFEIQVRQSPISSSLAVDSAIAMAVGNTRVALYADPKDLPDGNTSTPLRIDGKPVKLRKELKLDNGGKVYRKGSNYVIEWPTKEEVVAQVNSGSDNPFINISTFVFESQADHIAGLLGNDNGKKDDDLQFRDGRVLPSRSTYGDMKNILNRVVKVRLPIDPALNAYLKKLTKEYGNSWRINQEESLFDYAPGMTTDSFTLRGFPSEYLTLSQLPTNLVRDAQNTCSSSGVEPEMMEGCVFDVAYSGYGGFARAAAQASQVVDILEDLGIRVPFPKTTGREIKLPGGIRIPRPW